MACVLKRLGGKPTTAYGPEGLGDLIARGMSSHSSNRAVGWEYGRHGQTGRASEVLTALPSMAELIGEGAAELPLFRVVADVVLGQSGRQTTISIATDPVSRPHTLRG
jgi:glycerol-3-phosphate dehydrogenase